MISEVLPGSLILGLISFTFFNGHQEMWKGIVTSGFAGLILSSGAFLLLAWIIGTLIDAIRNGIIESVLDKFQKIDWDFFFFGDREKARQFEEYFFAYYLLDFNFVISILLTLLFFLSRLFFGGLTIPHPMLVSITLVFVGFIFFRDAYSLRKEMKGILDKQARTNGPGSLHVNTYTRLRPSRMPGAGVGVFAIRNIPKGTNIFSDDKSEMIWVDRVDVESLSGEIRKMYDDFCVIKDGQYGCPKGGFNNLTPGWYINEPMRGHEANVDCDGNYDFIAARDIRSGEELTADYSKYSESPNPVIIST